MSDNRPRIRLIIPGKQPVFLEAVETPEGRVEVWGDEWRRQLVEPVDR